MINLGITDDSVRIRELSVVIAAQNHNPTILNPDFLWLNEIAQADWKLASAPVCVEPFAQVEYTNDISVVSEPQKIVFTQGGEILSQDGILVVEMAHRYVRAVPHVDYRAVGINPKGDIGFETEEGPRRYIMEKLIAAGPWQDYGQGPARASAIFVFELEASKLFLRIQEAKRKGPNDASAPVVMFSGNFQYGLAESKRDEMLKALGEILDNWRACWAEYTLLVNSVFLKEL